MKMIVSWSFNDIPIIPLQDSMVTNFVSNMTILYPNPCYNELSYKGTVKPV